MKPKGVYTVANMTKDQIKSAIKQAIVLIHNKDTAPVTHSADYFRGLNILTRMVGWPNVYQHFDVDLLGDLDCTWGIGKDGSH